MTPGTSLNLEDQLGGSSCLPAAGNLLIRAQNFLVTFSRQRFLVAARLTATVAAPFNRAVTLPGWKYICVTCLLNGSEGTHL